MVLKGGENWIKKYRPVIIAEAHHHKQEMHDRLVEYGYKVYSIERLGLKKPQTNPDVAQYNWLAIHNCEAKLANKINRDIRLAALLPPIKYINPLVLTSSY